MPHHHHLYVLSHIIALDSLRKNKFFVKCQLIDYNVVVSHVFSGLFRMCVCTTSYEKDLLFDDNKPD